MAKTAVGLFENPGSVDKVVRDLEAIGFPRSDVRVLGEPQEMSGNGSVTSTPRTDFEVDLIRDLRAFGAPQTDAEAYVRGVQRGGVMVFATGSVAMADNAAVIMNQHCAIEIDRLNAVPTYLPGTESNEVAPDFAMFLFKLEGSAHRAPAPAFSFGRPSRNTNCLEFQPRNESAQEIQEHEPIRKCFVVFQAARR